MFSQPFSLLNTELKDVFHSTLVMVEIFLVNAYFPAIEFRNQNISMSLSTMEFRFVQNVKKEEVCTLFFWFFFPVLTIHQAYLFAYLVINHFKTNIFVI